MKPDPATLTAEAVAYLNRLAAADAVRVETERIAGDAAAARAALISEPLAAIETARRERDAALSIVATSSEFSRLHEEIATTHRDTCDRVARRFTPRTTVYTIDARDRLTASARTTFSAALDPAVAGIRRAVGGDAIAAPARTPSLPANATAWAAAGTVGILHAGGLAPGAARRGSAHEFAIRDVGGMFAVAARVAVGPGARSGERVVVRLLALEDEDEGRDVDVPADVLRNSEEIGAAFVVAGTPIALLRPGVVVTLTARRVAPIVVNETSGLLLDADVALVPMLPPVVEE